MKERQDRNREEAVELLRRLFHDESPVTYQGKYLRTRRCASVAR